MEGLSLDRTVNMKYRPLALCGVLYDLSQAFLRGAWRNMVLNDGIGILFDRIFKKLRNVMKMVIKGCLLYTSDAADD